MSRNVVKGTSAWIVRFHILNRYQKEIDNALFYAVKVLDSQVGHLLTMGTVQLRVKNPLHSHPGASSSPLGLTIFPQNMVTYDVFVMTSNFFYGSIYRLNFFLNVSRVWLLFHSML